MPTLGQIFYGRGPDGYGVLGASPAGRPHIGAVAALCRAVGSPDRPGEVPAFLLGKREGNAAIMIRACRGASDPTGRATIFFHALVADSDALRAAGLDAFALADAGQFADSCRSREPPDLPFPNMGRKSTAARGNRTLDLPATVSSERPLDALVRRELGAESLDRNWATFSFNPLPGFDLCVLSSYSPRKGAGTQYAFDGAGLHCLSSELSSDKKNASPPPSGLDSSKRSKIPLVASLVANAVLALALVAGVGKSGPDKSVETPTVAEMSESDAKAKWEEQWKAEWRETLPPTAPAMTESEAKAKWEAKWRGEWERSLPPPPSAMTESETKAKWEASWRTAWSKTLGAELKKAIRDSGGEWPVRFDDENSPFPPSVRFSQVEPSEEKTAVKWRIYRSCKTCCEFIQNHFTPQP